MSVNFGDGLSARELPKTLQAAYKLVGINNDAFAQYIVCPKCNAIFEYDAGYTMEGGKKVPRRCPKIHCTFTLSFTLWSVFDEIS